MTRPRATAAGATAATLAAVVLVLATILLTASDPIATLATFVGGPFQNRFAFGNFLSQASLLTLTGLGVVVAFRAGVFNLGGEGQLYLAALLVTVAATTWRLPAVLAVAVATAGAAVLAGLSGWLRHRTGADELITSFLLSAATIPVIDYLIVGPLRDGTGSLLATALVPESARLTRILPPSYLTTVAVWAVVAAIGMKLIMDKTLFGYEMRIVGFNRRLARFAGMALGWYTAVPMAISGAMHGLAGSALALGVHNRAIVGFSGGLGWNGIAVALIARTRPGLVVPAALLFAWLEAGARAAVVRNQTTWELGSLIQGIVFLFVTAHLIQRRIPTPAGAAPDDTSASGSSSGEGEQR